MTAVSDLHKQKDLEVAYLFVIEGIADCWVLGVHSHDPDALLGSGGGSWIGTTYGARRVRPGLSLDEPIFTEALDLSAGMLRDADVTVKLQDDETDYLAELFRSEFDDADLIRIEDRIKPSETAPSTKTIWKDSPNTTTVQDRHVGTEYIGPSGARRHFWIAPSDKPAGMDHPTFLGSGGDEELPPVYVSQKPYSWSGRYCAIYRIAYDNHEAAWPNWQDQYDGGSLIWYGTVRDRAKSLGNRQWELELAGATSWQRKQLNAHRPTRGYQPRAALDLSPEQGNDERGVCVVAYDGDLKGNNANHNFTGNLFVNPITQTSRSDIAKHVRDVLKTAVTGSTTGSILASSNTSPDNDDGGNYEDDAGSVCDMDSVFGDKVWISAKNDLYAIDGYEHRVELILHAKVWAFLGWDVANQPKLDNPETYADFREFVQQGVFYAMFDSPVVAPGPGYYRLIISTRPFGWAHPQYKELDNLGQFRTYKALFDGGITTLDPSTKQRVTLGPDRIYMEGQTARPFEDGVSIGGSTVDAAGWFAIVGQIKEANEDVEDLIQVIHASWVDDSGMIGKNANDETEIYIDRWEDPRLFGFPFERRNLPWNITTGHVEFVPLGVVAGYANDRMDEVYRAVPRILTSSGTSDPWTYTNGNPIPPANSGSNTTATEEASDFLGTDLEIQDLGLNIPVAFLDYDSFKDAAGQQLDLQTPLNNHRMAMFGAFPAWDILSSAMQQRALCFSWKKGSKGPQFGCFAPFQTLATGDATVTLDDSTQHGKWGDPSSWASPQELRYESPVDQFEIEARYDPKEDSTSYETKEKSYDRGYRGRRQRRRRRVKALGLPSIENLPINTDAWVTDFIDLFGHQLGEWFERRNFTLRRTVQGGDEANNCYPGTIVRVTDERPLAPNASYGLTDHPGIVISASHFQDRHAEVTLLMQGETNDAIRYWTAIAKVTGHDSGVSKLQCSSDWTGHGNGTSDTQGFVEMAWSTIAGTTSIRVIQSEDGETFPASLDWTADISSVDTSLHQITYTNASGTLYRDTTKYVVWQDHDDQEAGNWVTSRGSVVTKPTGKFGASDTQGFRLK